MSTPPLVVLPDTIELVRSYLAQVQEITDLVPMERITIRSPRDTSTPWVRLSRIGGLVETWPPMLDRCNLQAEAYTPPEQEETCWLIARTLRGALLGVLNYSGPGGVICGALDSMGLIYQPDTSRNPPTPRVIMAVSIYARPS